MNFPIHNRPKEFPGSLREIPDLDRSVSVNHNLAEELSFF